MSAVTWEKGDDDRWYRGPRKRLEVTRGESTWRFRAGVQRPNGTWETSEPYPASVDWITGMTGDVPDPFGSPNIDHLLDLIFDACWKLER